MILGLTGLKGSGKDTVAAHLIKEYKFERRAFADKLKQSAAALFDINPSEFEKLKNDDTAQVALGRLSDDMDYLYPFGSSRLISVREFLQRYGTESHRDVFGENFWVDQVLPRDGYYADRSIVITDCRFISESRRIKFLKGYIVRIVRGDSNQDPHRSELEQFDMEIDYTLNNIGPLEELPKQIDEMMSKLNMRET